MPELVLLIGLPGSGKSTWARQQYDFARIFNYNTEILSSDQVRLRLFGDENDQTHNEEVFDYIKARTVAKLQLGGRVVIDATNLTRKARASITDYVEKEISGFYEFGYIRYVIIATPYYKCLENNRKRNRQVPEEVIERMYKNFEFPTHLESVHQIDIVYPFGIDKEMYGVEHPYERFIKTSHETPYHTLTIGSHMEKAYEIMKMLTTNKVLLKAAELHDIGKVFCKSYTEEVNGVIRAQYLNHANVSSYEAMFYAKMSKFTLEETIELCILIAFHMRAHDCADSEKATRKLRSIVGEKLYYQLQLLKLADKEAH